MATAPEAAMDMPQEAAPNPFSDPNTMAVYDQMRQTVSPKEFGDEMLAGAAQTSPEDVAAFKSALEQIEMPPEALDLLNNMVDEILANPEQYAEIRAKYKEMDAPDEILPEQFDPQFFAALNMAVDQMIAAPAGVQAFAKGGIAELKPVAKAIADYGRNGDTMLAHITPAEARMLRRRGGSGTINPDTGLPEFFGLFKAIGKAFKAVGKAVKKFASSTVGRLVTTVALGFFLGPAAAGLVGATSTAAVAAVSGFVGSAGSTLLGGGNLKDALKAGAIGGLTAGVTTGITQGFGTAYQGPTTISGQVDKFTGMFKSPAFPQYTAQGALTDNATSNAAREAYAGELYKTNPEAFYNPAPTPTAPLPGQPGSDVLIGGKPPIPPLGANPPAGVTPPTDPSFMDQAKDFYNKNISPSGIQQQGTAAAQEAGAKAITNLTARLPDATAAMKEAAYQTAYKSALPGILSTYGPITAAGIGAIGAFGGFKPSDPTPSALKPELMKSATQRIEEQGKQKEYYIQGLPGVQYDEKGAPIYGQYNPLPTYEAPAFAGGYGGGIASLPNSQTYVPPPGVVGGSAPVYQPYNTASMYSNLVPRRYEEGGTVTAEKTAADKVAADKVAADKAAATAASQAANREAVRAQEQQQRAAGFGEAYANINAGLAYNAPSSMAAMAISPERAAMIRNASMDPAAVLRDRASPGQGISTQRDPAGLMQVMRQQGVSPQEMAQVMNLNFGDLNRQYQTETMQSRFNPAAQASQYRAANETALGFKPTPAQGPTYAPIRSAATSQYDQMIRDAYAGIGRSGIGTDASNIDQQGYNNFMNELQAGKIAPDAFNARFDVAKSNYMSQNPNDKYTNYVNKYVTAQQQGMPKSGIASLAAGGYPRKTGQISGPGTATSDSIPAMLSDGEFVMTAKAVRGAGKGDRRAGAKRMYALMNQLEKNAARG
jgi:hypothetical protein